MDSEHAIEEIVNDFDAVIIKYQNKLEPHNISAIMLSRITLLMTHDPTTAKGLLQFVWDKMDELEQSNPGQYL